MVRLTDRPDMTVDVYRGRKTTIQQQQQMHSACLNYCTLVDSSTIICWTSPFIIVTGVRSILSLLVFFDGNFC